MTKTVVLLLNKENVGRTCFNLFAQKEKAIHGLMFAFLEVDQQAYADNSRIFEVF